MNNGKKYGLFLYFYYFSLLFFYYEIKQEYESVWDV